MQFKWVKLCSSFYVELLLFNASVAMAGIADSSQPYIDFIKKGTSDIEEVGESYTERLRKSDPEFKESRSSESYTEVEKQKLGSSSQESAIQSFYEGRSALEPKKRGNIHSSFGLRYSVSPNREFIGSVGTQFSNYGNVYGQPYAPEIGLFYEYQPFHSRSLGSLGVVALAGFGSFPGLNSSNQTSQFFMFPTALALNYRLNILNFVRPFFMVGPAALGYFESRSDNQSASQGLSSGAFFSSGASLLLDWIFSSEAWSLYSTFGIQHYYLTVEYSRLLTTSKDDRFIVHGLNVGISFEY